MKYLFIRGISRKHSTRNYLPSGLEKALQVVSFGVNSISVSDEDKLKIQNMQQAIFMSDPSMAAGNIASAQADAMRTAAGNENGAMMGFMGMGMAAQASGLNAGNLFQMGQQQQQARQRHSSNSRLSQYSSHSRLRQAGQLLHHQQQEAGPASAGQRPPANSVRNAAALSRQKHRDGPVAAAQ